jgi:hypothetical protein
MTTSEWQLSPCKKYVYKKHPQCPELNDGRCHGSCDVGLRGEDCFYETSDKYVDVIKTMINLGESNNAIEEHIAKLRSESYLLGVKNGVSVNLVKHKKPKYEIGCRNGVSYKKLVD